ncbi:hypothetical protein QYY51_19350 [Enterobacter hormaechei]|uniref:hypothetical protein n=1 Tax=Enterobacter hormaechei TaxID=158836 RepID=UPI00263AA348|nr:hypothetical protein [Enterobacter hormaechei]MDN4966310.1 hypothetical protein [Enterobacter hormaechei]MDO6156334.1 hypothetical protein [Enterobacter hormaechei]
MMKKSCVLFFSLASLLIISGCSSKNGNEQQKVLLKSSASECASSIISVPLKAGNNGNASGQFNTKITNGSPKVSMIINGNVTEMYGLDGTEITFATSVNADQGVPKSAWVSCMRDKGFVISDL